MHLRLGLDVDALCWFIKNQQIRLRGQPFGQNDLLLVASDSVLIG